MRGFDCTWESCVLLCMYKHRHAHMLAWAAPGVRSPIVLSYMSTIQMDKDIFMGSLLYFSSDYFSVYN